MRGIVVALMLSGASALPAQMGAIDKARKVATATEKHLSAETGQKLDTMKNRTRGQPNAASKQPQPVVGAAKASSTGAKAASRGIKAAPKRDSIPSFVMRETFDYERAGRRDPFVSLLTTSDLRPIIGDLHLLGIVYDPSGRRSVAVMRDLANVQYLATVGQMLGRMRVSQIRPRAIIFTIEEFGFSRQDSLVLSDTTKARP
jgi:hypothetical protein